MNSSDTKKLYDAFGVSPLHRQYPPRRRVTLHCPETSITDQEHAREFSMAAIKQKMERGIPPQLTNDGFYDLKPLKYTNLQDAIDFQQEVVQRFEALPTEIRKGMGNNIANFESYLQDPKNLDTLHKYGLANKPNTQHQEILDALKELKPQPSDSKPASKQQKQPE